MTEVEKEQKQARFRNDLQDLLNRHCMENGSNTPDYQLADYLISCLHALDETINKRASWYGRFYSPGQAPNASNEPTPLAAVGSINGLGTGPEETR